MATKVYFVRHGESEMNLVDGFAGYIDAPLTELGRQQAASTAEYLASVPFDVFYGSDLSRAYETGCIIAEKHGLPVQPVKELREIYSGEWEGRTFKDLISEYPDDYGRFRDRIGLAVCTGGEAVAHLQYRVYLAVSEIVSRHPNQVICIATHATPIRCMECLWTQTPLAEMHTIPWVLNASVTIAEFDDTGKGRLCDRNIHSHLGALCTRVSGNV